MRLLLDTNVLLWVLKSSPRINPVRGMILADENDVFVSAVSWWEIAIKARIGKLQVSLPELRKAAEESGFFELRLLGSHAEPLVDLPKLHKDPFDHMIVSQAIWEKMHLITGDSIMTQYYKEVTEV